MKKLLTSASLILIAAPAYAVEGAPLFSLRNTNFVVGIAFVAFVALLIYMGIPKKIGGMLDARAVGIKTDLDEARQLRDEARALLETYEAKQREVAEQSARIVATAKGEAEADLELCFKMLPSRAGPSASKMTNGSLSMLYDLCGSLMVTISGRLKLHER